MLGTCAFSCKNFYVTLDGGLATEYMSGLKVATVGCISKPSGSALRVLCFVCSAAIGMLSAPAIGGHV